MRKIVPPVSTILHRSSYYIMCAYTHMSLTRSTQCIPAAFMCSAQVEYTQLKGPLAWVEKFCSEATPPMTVEVRLLDLSARLLVRLHVVVHKNLHACGNWSGWWVFHFAQQFPRSFATSAVESVAQATVYRPPRRCVISNIFHRSRVQYTRSKTG